MQGQAAIYSLLCSVLRLLQLGFRLLSLLAWLLRLNLRTPESVYIFGISHSLEPRGSCTCRPDSGGVEPVSPYLAVRKKEASHSHMLCQLCFASSV